MLKILRRIVQEVNAARDLPEALDTVVHGVNEAMNTEACAIFLADPELGKNILVATEGLNKNLVGKVQLKLGEGLVGLVGERAEPINLENAATHPNYTHYPELGEENFKSFLGVPLIHQRHVMGVLFVLQKEARCFDEAEEAFLVTLSAQLAGTIAHAVAIGAVKSFTQTTPQAPNDITIGGVSGAPGVSMGTAVVVYPLAEISAVPERQTKNIEDELALFDNALNTTRKTIKQLGENMAAAGLPAEEQALFDVYLKLLDSQSLIDEIKTEISNGHWAQGALKRVITHHIARFEAMDDHYLRERASDLKDLGQRVLANLQSTKDTAIEYPEKTVLVGDEVTPSALAEVPEGRLTGLVSTKGSGNSHVAILARALGVPTVLGVSGVDVTQLDGEELIVDGYYGQVYRSPSPALRQEFLTLINEELEFDKELESLCDMPAKTVDGHTISLHVNTGLAPDIGSALSFGAEGVGLYRTEVPFMTKDRFPSEEEQRVIYRQLLHTFAPRPVVMRTLDIGGDKTLPYFQVEEDNPFLGWRGIRVTLDHPEILLVQLRAMMQASVGLDNLHIMFPMITTISEIEEATRLLNQAYEETVAEGFDIKMPKFGVMAEVPSAVYQAQILAKKVDFLSVGSNDLIQYLLAVDRNNSRVAYLYDSLHPAVLRALMQLVAGAHREGKKISLCGEMSGDPAAVILLLAIGFDALSMNPNRLPRMKWVIRQFTLKHARKLLDEVLEMDDAIEIRGHMELALEEAGMGGLIRAGRW
jgi:phosphotransferase system enzyme I (PtsP)